MTAMAPVRLGGREDPALVERLAGGPRRKTVDEIIEHGDGVPLSAEKLAKRFTIR
jgi:hypothetical protein